jgi:hypothetical protein
VAWPQGVVWPPPRVKKDFEIFLDLAHGVASAGLGWPKPPLGSTGMASYRNFFSSFILKFFIILILIFFLKVN